MKCLLLYLQFYLLSLKGENNDDVDDDECMHTYLFRAISYLAIRLEL